MAKELKTVGLIFKADGSVDFRKSIENVNATLKKNYEQFKLTQAQWDQSTTSTQKLRDRLVYLNNAYDITDDKVKTLQMELKDLENAENRNEVAIKKKEAALKQAETSLQKYENQIKNVETQLKNGTARLKDYSDKLEKLGSNLENAGKKFSAFSIAYTTAMGLSVKSAIDFESAFTGVTKTVDGTEEQLDNLKQGIRDLAKTIPSSTTEISAIAETAGQLGIGVDDILNFTSVMIDLGQSTNLSAETAASSLAKLANIMGTSSDDYRRLGSTIVDLGNNFATTEADITAMAMRLAGAGKTIGLSEANVLSLATALSSVGIEAEMGGSAMSKAMSDIYLACETGAGNFADLATYAEVAGMSTKEFANLMKKDAVSAISAFVLGIGDTDRLGQSALATLEELGFKEVRLRDTMLRAANAGELFNNAISLGSKAWEENVALTNEAEKRYSTTESRMAMVKNTLNDLAITFGEIVLPKVQQVLDKIADFINKIDSLDPSIKNIIVSAGAFVTALSLILIIAGKVSNGISSIISLVIKLNPLLVTIKTAIGGISASTLGMIGIIALVVAAVAGLAYVIYKNWDSIVEWTVKTVDSIKEAWNNAIEKIKSIIQNVSDFFSEKFQTIKEICSNIVSNIVSFFSSIKDTADKIISEIVDVLSLPFDYVKNAFIAIVAIVAIFLESIYNLVVNIISSILEPIIGLYQIIKENLESFISVVSEKLQQILTWIQENIINPLRDLVKECIDNIVSFISELCTNISSFFSSVFENAKQIFSDIANFIGGIFNDIWKNFISPIFENFKNGFLKIKDTAVSIFNSIKDTVSNIFSTIGGIVKAPINGIIGAINGVLKSLNKLKVPDWVPGIGGQGVNFKMIEMLAKGGDLIQGSAIVAEAGPELLMQQGNHTKVLPLTNGGGATPTQIIDYNKLLNVFSKALSNCKLALDDEGFVRIIDNRLREVV